ncbi:MAG TPA: fibronectin type III domain-containing protein [Verrucomicrobiae bacterium]|nr:fibronectin type III domain-containing protein [Verrucomicrobiae bacterium]
MPQVSLSGISALQNVPAGTTVYIRYYASGQTTTGGWGFNSPSAGSLGLDFGGAVNPLVPSAPTANAASAITSTSFSANWSAAATATGYQLDVATDSGFTAFVPGFNNLDVGNVLTATVAGLSANTAYHYRVRAYNAGGTSGNSSTIDVTTSSTATPKITVTLPGQLSANSGTPSDETAGTAFNVTLTATTDGTAVNSSYNGVKNITFSGPTGSPTYPSTVTFSSGVGTANITLTKVETPTLTATDGTIAGTPSSSFTVNPGAIDHYLVTAAAAQVIGAAFNVNVTAKDVYENIVTTDSSTSVTMNSGSGNVGFAVNPVTLASGTVIASAADGTLETTTITATDGNSKTGTSGSIVINPAPQYRSKQNGNWGDFTTWQVNSGSGFVDATIGQTPDSSSADTIEIRSPHVVTVAAPVTVDQVTVDVGAQITTTAVLTVTNGTGTDLDVFGTLNSSASLFLTNSPAIVFETGGKYQHNFTTAGTIPKATWNIGSTCEIDNQTSGNTPGGLAQVFYNFTWNCPSQGANISMGGGLTNVSGDLTILSTGTKEFRFGAGTSPTITIGGNWLVQGGTNVTSTGAGSPTINLAGNLVVSGGGLNLGSGAGTTTINAANNVSVTGGSLTLGTGTGNFNFAKAGTQTFTGGGTISGAINWTVNDGSTLDTGASTVGGTGTFTVSGNGTIIGNGTIDSTTATINGTLSPGTSSTIGTLTFANAPTFSSTSTNHMKLNRNGGTPLADKVVASSGALNYAGALVVANIGTALQVNDTFTLFTASSYNNPFDTSALPTGYTWDTSPLTTSGAITVTAVAGGAPALNLSASGGILTFNWTDPSFSLQSSTNVAGPYATIPGAVTGFTTNAALSIVRNQFFRLSN